MAKKKLVHYFDSHSITMTTFFPLGEIINNHDATGRIAKWAMELMSYDVLYTPHIAIKSQDLADFITKWIEGQAQPALVDLEYWNMYFDRSLMLQGSRAGVILVSPNGNNMRYVLQLCFDGASNNIAEYEAQLHGLRTIGTLSIRRLVASRTWNSLSPRS